MSIFDYSKKRDVKRSKILMRNQNGLPANFGSLCVAYKKRVIPYDTWDLTHNTLTKVFPFINPAFSRIKQNFYSFFVSNQTVWKHWMNFASNGTDYQDVYGNNVVNQKLDNLWQVPSINCNDLQIIAKIAHGFAIPVARFNHDDLARIFVVNFETAFVGLKEILSDQFSDVTPVFCPFMTDLQRNILPNCSFPYFRGYARVVSGRLELALEVGGSYRDLYELYIHSRGGSHFSGSSAANPDKSKESDLAPHTIRNYFSKVITVRFFKDSFSRDCSLNRAPFILRKVKHTNTDTANGTSFTDYQYFINDFMPSVDQDSSESITQKASSPYFGVQYKEGESINVNFHSLTSQFVGFTNDYIKSLVNSDMVPAFGWFNSDSSQLLAFNAGDFTGWGTAHWSNPWTRSMPFTTNKNASLFPDVIFDGDNLPCDLPFPIYSNFSTTGGQQMYHPTQIPDQCPDAMALGYNDWAFCVYLCKQACKNLDYFNVTIEGLVFRDFSEYAQELVNALPFFAYSKIWNEYFRNKAVSSPELDFSETNGMMFMDSNRISYIKSLPSAPQTSIFENPEDLKPNSWVIPFCVSPKNGLAADSDSTVLSQFPVNIQDHLSLTQHYLNIGDWWTAFSVLTGFQLQQQVLLSITAQSYKFDLQDGSNFKYNHLITLVCDNFYLPSYYNGLLHLKYQNFNRDMFSAALLDPMSGANQVEIGDTINDLREEQAEQSFWERTAMARSLASWWRSTFGVTPVHVENDLPVFLGSDHIDINIGEVLQTSQTDLTPQGTRTGLAASHGSGGLSHHQFSEHGYIFTLVSHTVKSQYFQGFDPDFQVPHTFLDLPFIDFANIGNESIPQKFLNFITPASTSQRFMSQFLSTNFQPVKSDDSKIHYLTNSNGSALALQYVDRVNNLPKLSSNLVYGSGTYLNSIFGYTPRWTEYKVAFDEVHGSLRNTMNAWHSFRQFFNQPILCHEFVNWEMAADDNNLNRLFAAEDDDLSEKFLLDIIFTAKVKRPMPLVNIPSSK